MHSFTPILAEVSDKVPTIGGIWIVTAVISAACLFASAWRRRAALAVLPIIALWGVIITSEVRDPYVGPAIVSELGRGYVTQAYVAAVVPLVFVAIGFLRQRHNAA
jgi:UDP-N-acetylmuramyl pentapeptide phosphotransferase/UDP-N-acetylglucosamine-1-phosphate transferase